MKKVYLPLFVSIGLLLGNCSKKEGASDRASISEVSAQESKILPMNDQSTTDRYIVKLKDDFIPDEKIGLLGNYDQSIKMFGVELDPLLHDLGINPEVVVHRYYFAFKGFAAPLTTGQLEKVLAHPFVDIVSADQFVSIDAKVTKSVIASCCNSAQVTPWGINRVGGVGSGFGRRAWILDTGVDLDHCDLFVDTILSRSFSTLDGALLNGGDDNHGHGTHVAGTVAALDNSYGVVGVAPDARIVSVKVLSGSGSGLVSDVIAGAGYAGAVGQLNDAANLSLSGGANSLVDLAIQASSAKVWFVLAAGNDRHHANNNSPARANGSRIITVSAFRNGDSWASFSNYGNPPVDLCAPGQSIYSTYRNNSCRTLSGTSMAAPHVTGILLTRGAYPATSGFVSGDPDGNSDPIAHR